MQTSSALKQNSFAEDVRKGLSSEPKFLSSKYFYDDQGSRLFQRIMDLPEYYLTRAEFEIFETQTKDIYETFTERKTRFDLIELGAGDGMKTAVLIDYFLKRKTDFKYSPIDISQEAVDFLSEKFEAEFPDLKINAKTAVLIDYFLGRKADFTYSPIDISQEAVDYLTEKFEAEFPDLKINAKTGDYFRILETLKSESTNRKVILFLGSNIGNFSREQALDFFKRLRQVMSENDLLFIGFDLQKDPRVILQAYDDRHGVTAAFNLNLLKRINRELGANFNTNNFSHYAIYRPVECAARSFLISRENQTVYIESLNSSFEFKQWEPIFMEISQKYSLEMIADLAAASGFAIVQNFYDSRNYFIDSLWKLKDKTETGADSAG